MSPSCLWTLGNLRTVWELDLELRESRQWRWWQAHLVPKRFGLGCWVRFSMKYHEISLSLLHHSYHSYDWYDLIHMIDMAQNHVLILRYFRSSDSFLPWPNPSAEHPSRSPHSRDLPWGWFVRFPARNVQCKAVELQTFCLFLQNSSQRSSHKVTKSEATTLNLHRIADQSSNPWQFTESDLYISLQIFAFEKLQTKPGATWSPAQKWFFLRLTKWWRGQNVRKKTPKINCTIPRAVL